jgi:L-alanine-DL-glutamate epimerase-like enolase superfamily enzyme
MKLELFEVALPLRHEFTIARGSLTSQEAMIVALTHNGHTGWGEVTANPYYGFDLATIRTDIESVRDILEASDQQSPEELWQACYAELPHNPFALCAIDLSYNDLWARLAGKRLLEAWGLSTASIPASSYTIGIDAIDTMIMKLKEMPGWGCYKIKLGTPTDIDIVRALRQHTDATFRVDANCGWSVDETIAKSHALKALGVEFIEQPLPADATPEDKSTVYRESALPIVADENCIEEQDVAACRPFFHGVNVKLCKCGGLTPARRMLLHARSLGLKTMVGCMIESSIGISAAAQLLPLLDYADLDGAILLRHEPARGVTIDRGQVALVDAPGTGAELLRDRLSEFAISRNSRE